MKFIKLLLRSFKKDFFDNTEYNVLPLIVLSITFLYVSLFFSDVVSEFITSDIIVNADVRVNTLFYFFRNELLVKIFTWITLFGESAIIIVFALIASIFLWLWRKKTQIFIFWFTIIGSEGFTYIAKLLFNRSRPTNAVFLETSNSFPSGHAAIAVAFYGFLTYLLLKKKKSGLQQSLIAFIAVIFILFIGFSRLYLGVHYVSDVLAGFLVGLSWLIIGIGIIELKLFQKPDCKSASHWVIDFRKIILGGLIGSALIFYIIYGLT